MPEKNDIAVEVKGLSKNYGDVRALKSIDLQIGAGEYFVLLGPSGGGKTTLLRLIGGFIRPTAGEIFLHSAEVSHLPPNGRPTSMVFQSFALFPHMNVQTNVGYGLRLRNMPKVEIRERVDAMLEMVGLTGYGERMPHELSGGQQQRVQLARSLVLEVKILLLDEPLAALDAKLRKEMCIELKRIQEKVGITFIHVTHNQEEAMTVADDLAIISGGKLLERGKARDLYENPIHRFTAEFIGENNVFDGHVTAVDGEGHVMVDLGYTNLTVHGRDQMPGVGDKVSISVRSELVQLVDGNAMAAQGQEILSGTHRKTVYLGLTTSELVRLPNGQELLVRQLSDGSGGNGIKVDEAVQISWRTVDGRLHVS
ncbi:MAG: ABC transporter ATP-binding protein [Alphaproteobacteria bacterium]|nr:ABC transporter ATP-binding protein [Alphaproteobacteria bacterium]